MDFRERIRKCGKYVGQGINDTISLVSFLESYTLTQNACKKMRKERGLGREFFSYVQPELKALDEGRQMEGILHQGLEETLESRLTF